MERIGAASVISEATSLYNAEKYQDALGTYRTALSTPQGEQLRAQSGVYLAEHEARPASPRPSRRSAASSRSASPTTSSA